MLDYIQGKVGPECSFHRSSSRDSTSDRGLSLESTLSLRLGTERTYSSAGQVDPERPLLSSRIASVFFSLPSKVCTCRICTCGLSRTGTLRGRSRLFPYGASDNPVGTPDVLSGTRRTGTSCWNNWILFRASFEVLHHSFEGFYVVVDKSESLVTVYAKPAPELLGFVVMIPVNTSLREAYIALPTGFFFRPRSLNLTIVLRVGDPTNLTGAPPLISSLSPVLSGIRGQKPRPSFAFPFCAVGVPSLSAIITPTPMISVPSRGSMPSVHLTIVPPKTTE